jgi:L-alanine-DL-glutamate epimerase-like enolase superfamily enzyme
MGPMMHIAEINLFQIKLPLKKPYRVSFRTYTEFEPILIEMRDRDGRSGWGEAYIPAGSTTETIESGWSFCREHAGQILGRSEAEARAVLESKVPHAPFAATAMLTALDMLVEHPALEVNTEARIPLLVPVSAKASPQIDEEVERLLETGYRTLKVKVGWDVDEDLKRVGAVQRAVQGRAEITMDANRGYTEEQGKQFASSLDPAGIALFEQPCEADEWQANAAVAKVSTVPLMLDESIRNQADIERAAGVENVKFVKLKLKRVGGIQRAIDAMTVAKRYKLDICLGDGVATDLLCWVEACVSRGFLERAGDMNGFLKPKTTLFKEPLAFDQGSIVLKPGFWPEIDRAAVAAHELRSETFRHQSTTTL